VQASNSKEIIASAKEACLKGVWNRSKCHGKRVSADAEKMQGRGDWQRKRLGKYLAIEVVESPLANVLDTLVNHLDSNWKRFWLKAKVTAIPLKDIAV